MVRWFSRFQKFVGSLSVVLGLFFAQAEPSAWARDNKEPKKRTKEPAPSKEILDVKSQVSDPLRKRQNEDKLAEREAAKKIAEKPPNYVDPFDTSWTLGCQPNQANCYERPKNKIYPQRHDGLELGK
jgi:hypothetical protein